MAEAISLGASVLAFITITAQLSKITAGLYVTLNDAPEDIARLRTRLEDLHFILSEINRLRSSFPDCDTSSEIQRYWNDKSKRLELDFKEFRKFTDGLNTKDVKGKIRWFLSHRDHAKTVLVILSEDIDILRTLYQIIESHRMNHFEQLVRTQLPTMAQVLQVVNRVSAEMVTRDDFKRQHDKFLDQIKPCPTLSRQTHKENTKPGLANPIANPNIYSSYISYSLPIGVLEMYYDWEYNDSAKDSSSGSIYIAHARWKFQPVPWLSYKAFVTKASFLMRCGNELNRPILTPTLTASCFLSDKHPVWSMIKEGDLRGIRGLLDEGSISIRDTDTKGNTILHKAFYWLAILYWDSSMYSKGVLDIVKYIVQSDADCNTLNNINLTPLQLLFLLFGMHRLTVTSDILDGVQALIEANMLLVDGLAEEEDNMHMFKATMLIASHLEGTFKADYLSILNEYTLKLLKKEPCDGGEGYPGGYEQVITLVAAYCGQLQLPSLWSKYCTHLPKDEGSTLEASVELLDDIVALTRIDSAGILGERTLGYHTLKYQALEYAFRTGNITAANKILSAVFGHCLADFGLEFFGSDHGLQLWKIGLPPEVFRAGNKETLEIFERVGGKPANIRYMFMFHAMGHWSSDLQQQLMDEADSTVLSQLLRDFSDFRLFTPVKTLPFLIFKGADVNYFDENCPPHTALAAAASHGSIDSINILLEHGADILLGTEQGAISELLRLWCEKTGSTNWYTYDEMKGLIEWLENIEREEREKRNVPNPPVTVIDIENIILEQPHSLQTHLLVVAGVLLTAIEGIRHLFVLGLWWVLKSRRMVFWLFGWFSYLVGECVAHCGWAILGACFMGNARQGAIDQCLDCN